MIYVFYSIHVIVCLFLIMVVLLQQGKGADLSVFGGGSTQTAFGARGAATVLHKLTVVSFVLFILTTLSIAVYQIGPGGASVLSDISEEQVEETTSPEPLEAGAEGGETPTAVEAPPAPAPEGDEAAAPAGSPDEATAPPEEPTEQPAEPPAEPGDGGR